MRRSFESFPVFVAVIVAILVGYLLGLRARHDHAAEAAAARPKPGIG